VNRVLDAASISTRLWSHFTRATLC